MAWSKLGSTTLGSAGDTISLSTFTPSQFNQILINIIPSGLAESSLRVGYDTIDSGTNYASRYTNNGLSDATATNNSDITNRDTLDPQLVVAYMSNIATDEKLYIGFMVGQSTAGAGNAPTRSEYADKWANTSNQFNKMDVVNGQSGDINTDSNLTLLGSEGTEVPALGANLQNGSRYEETDTRKMYNLKAADTPMYESDFSSSTGWTTVGSNISITGGVIQASSMATQSDNRIYYDLGSALSDQFVIDFDHYADSASAGAFWGMFALTDTTSIPRTDDSIHVLIDMGSWTGYLRHSDEGSETNIGSLGNLTTGQWQYARFVRDGTTGTLTVYSDSDRTTQVLSASGTIPATVTGLRYFQTGALTSGNSGTTTYKIDNLKVYDGITSITTSNTWQEIGA